MADWLFTLLAPTGKASTNPLVVQDAAEEHDRATDHPEIVLRLADRLDAYANDPG